MKCKLFLVLCLALNISIIQAEPGLGELASNINPVIQYGTSLVQLLMAFLSLIFIVYSYTLWRSYQRNPAFTSLSGVMTALFVGIFCGLFAFIAFQEEQSQPVQASAPKKASITQKSKPGNLKKIKNQYQNVNLI